MCKDLAKKMHAVMIKKFVQTRSNKQWNKKEEKLKKEALGKVRNWKKITKAKYLRTRKRYKIKCEEKKQQKEEEINKIRVITTESEMWKFLNKEKKKQKQNKGKHSMDKFRIHFMDILGVYGQEMRCL